MVRVFNGRILGVLLLALTAAACDDEVTTPPTTPTPAVTETSSGAAAQNGAVTHSSSASGGGAGTATLKTIGPDNTLVVTLALGTWTGTACSVVLANDVASGGAVLTGT